MRAGGRVGVWGRELCAARRGERSAAEDGDGAVRWEPAEVGDGRSVGGRRDVGGRVGLGEGEMGVLCSGMNGEKVYA